MEGCGRPWKAVEGHGWSVEDGRWKVMEGRWQVGGGSVVGRWWVVVGGRWWSVVVSGWVVTVCLLAAAAAVAAGLGCSARQGRAFPHFSSLLRRMDMATGTNMIFDIGCVF